ncbi:MAG: hypothetical protein UR12_C0016G0014 [candidate division TM6 bacterium GW2011_GWF2_30_66]|jgi:rubrerythrin|nr:MAG: hypothetical protein UR12_C0016G0014 [candidate division TM6 bacterium GW2011_GWF2_30_66]
MNKKIIGILSVVLIVSTNINLYSVSFGNPFGVMNPDRKMTKQELIKATRLMMSAEFEAVQNYMQVAESIDDILAKKVFTDIANEERVHAGEFLRLLNYLDPEENEFYKKGAAEVEEEIKKLEPKPEQPKIEEEITKTVPATKESEKKEPISSINVSVEAETVSIKTTEPSLEIKAETISEKTTTPEVIKPEITALETKTESKTTETAVPEIIEKKQEPVQEQINAKEIEEPMQNPVEEKKIQKPNTIEKINNTEQKPVDKVLIESEIEDIADPIEFNIIEEDENEISVEPTDSASKNNEPINPEDITTKPLNPAKLIIKNEPITKPVLSESKGLETENKQSNTKEKTGSNHLDVKKLITEKLNAVLKPTDNKINKDIPVASTQKNKI